MKHRRAKSSPAPSGPGNATESPDYEITLSEPVQTTKPEMTFPDPKVDWENFSKLKDPLDLESCWAWEIAREIPSLRKQVIEWRASHQIAGYTLLEMQLPPKLCVSAPARLAERMLFLRDTDWPFIPWNMAANPTRRSVPAVTIVELCQPLPTPDVVPEVSETSSDWRLVVSGLVKPRTESELIDMVRVAWRAKYPPTKDHLTPWEPDSQKLLDQFRVELRALAAYRFRRAGLKWPKIENLLKYRELSPVASRPGDAPRKAFDNLIKRYQLPPAKSALL
jgi:hypothetical protein